MYWLEFVPLGCLKTTKQMPSQCDGWKNPFGDGKASNFIMDYIATKYVSFKYKIK
jgi:hypothetical protein